MRRRRILIAVTILCAGLSLGAGVVGALAPVRGEWTLNTWTLGPGLRLGMTHRSGTSVWKWTTDRAIDDLEGLTREQLHGVRVPVAFRLHGDTGTFAFEGSLTLGIGKGSFRFQSDPEFATKLRALGYEPPGDDELFGLALREISLAYAGEVKRLAPATTLRDLVGFHDRGIGIDYLREIGAVAYPGIGGSEVVRLHEHGVDPSYLRALRDAGYAALDANAIVALHEHGVDGRYVAEITASGVGTLPPEQIIYLHEHGVASGYIARVRDAGFTNLSVDQIVKLHEHGVD